MAGFVASNILKGDMAIVPMAESLPYVRMAQESWIYALLRKCETAQSYAGTLLPYR